MTGQKITPQEESKLKSILLSNEIFSSFKPQEIAQILSVCKLVNYRAGKVIVRKGKSDQRCFVMIKGSASVISNNQVIFKINSGELFGELGFYTLCKRTATVTSNVASKILILDHETVSRNYPKLLLLLNDKISNLIVRRLENTSTDYAKLLEKSLHLEKQKNLFGFLFICIVFIMTISNFVTYLVFTKHDINIYSPKFSWSYMLLIIAPIIFVVLKLRLSLSSIGLAFINKRKTIIDCIVVSSIGVSIILYLSSIIDNKLGLDLHPFHFYYPYWINFSYLLQAIIQEFVGRGIMVGALIIFWNNLHRYYAVMIASFIFAMLHIQFGFSAVFITLIFSFLMGFLYLRHRNIYGISIIHGILGLLCFGIGLI